MGLRFIDNSVLKGIADSIRYRCHEVNSGRKYSTNNMILRIGQMGKDLGADLKMQGGVFLPYSSLDMSDAYRQNQAVMFPVCGDNVTNMSNAYSGCSNLIGSPVCGDNVTNMVNAYSGCSNLTGSPVCGPNVYYNNMVYAYSGCSNLTGSPVCGDNVTNMEHMYNGCSNLTGSPVCGPNVTRMINTYNGCSNLTGSPVCGPYVFYMHNTYNGCSNLTGSPVCGRYVVGLQNAYRNCSNLTGVAVCGDNVANMVYAYSGCSNLTGLMINNLSKIPSGTGTGVWGAVANANNVKNYIAGINGPSFTAFTIRLLHSNLVNQSSYTFTDKTASENIWFNHLRTWNGYIDVDCGTSYQESNVDNLCLYKAVYVREY